MIPVIEGGGGYPPQNDANSILKQYSQHPEAGCQQNYFGQKSTALNGRNFRATITYCFVEGRARAKKQKRNKEAELCTATIAAK